MKIVISCRPGSGKTLIRKKFFNDFFYLCDSSYIPPELNFDCVIERKSLSGLSFLPEVIIRTVKKGDQIAVCFQELVTGTVKYNFSETQYFKISDLVS